MTSICLFQSLQQVAACRRLRCVIFSLCALLVFFSTNLQAKDWRICPTGSDHSHCYFQGYSGIQKAIDQSVDGDRLIISPGLYHPEDSHDVAYEQLVIRGGALIENKTLQLVGEKGAILDGSSGPKVSALLISNSQVKITGLEIRNFRVDQAEDDVYEGHGIFIINSQVVVQETELNHIPKMSMSIFGNSKVTVSRIKVLNGHVGIWVEGESKVQVENSLFSRNDTAPIAAYDHTTTNIYNSVFEASLDDAVYANEKATIFVSNSIFVENKPYAIRAEGEATIEVDYSIFHGNEALFFPEVPNDQISVGEHIYLEDPNLDSDYRIDPSFQPTSGDPAVRNRDGAASTIGLFGGPAAPEPSNTLE